MLIKQHKLKTRKLTRYIMFHELQMMCTCGRQSKNDASSMAQ